jgi:hypothetical protein
MPKHSLSIGVAALVAAVVLPAQANAEHENRYFGFGYRPFYNPPPVYYPPPPRVRETAPGVYEYEVAPGRWVRIRPGHSYDPRRERFRTPPRPQPQEALRNPAPPPVPQTKPDEPDDAEVAVQSPPAAAEPAETPTTTSPVTTAPATTAPVQSAAQAPAPAGSAMSCEAAAEIVESFGFSDVKSTSCSGDVYGFDAARDGNDYSIKLSAANGELTEVRKR